MKPCAILADRNDGDGDEGRRRHAKDFRIQRVIRPWMRAYEKKRRLSPRMAKVSRQITVASAPMSAFGESEN
jgi:hypothetical protein